MSKHTTLAFLLGAGLAAVVGHGASLVAMHVFDAAGLSAGGGSAWLHLGLALVLAALQGALHGVLTGHPLLELLPEAQYLRYAVNTATVFGLERFLMQLPFALYRSEGASSLLAWIGAYGTVLGFVGALALGFGQWLSFRDVPRSKTYIGATLLGELLTYAWRALLSGIGIYGSRQTSVPQLLMLSVASAMLMALPQAKCLELLAKPAAAKR